jgi:predicted nucleic acid-binding protein
MGRPYLMDTNAVIDYLNGKLPDACVAAIDENGIEISVITRIELLAWHGATGTQLTILNNFIASCIVHQLNEPVILAAIEIRKTKACKLPDAIIAATAITMKLILLTNNTTDFNNINTLTLNNPYLL